MQVGNAGRSYAFGLPLHLVCQGDRGLEKSVTLHYDAKRVALPPG
jgi:hypothetical protein